MRELDRAEQDLSVGKPMGKQMRITPVLAHPAIAARHTIAAAVDTVLSDKYSDGEAQDIRRKLVALRKDPLVPHNLKIEAGYMLVLLERIESLKNAGRISNQQKEKCMAESEKGMAENERLKKELEELQYKLRKIEEIHIHTEMKRGAK